MDDYLKSEQLKALRGPLLQTAGVKVLSLYADLLDQEVEKEAPGRDHNSYWLMWRPSIASVEDEDARLIDEYVNAIRDDALAFAASHPDRVPEIIQLLIERRGIYERIAFYLLARVDNAGALVRSEMRRRDLWVARSMSPEFAELVHTRSAELTDDDVLELASWIAEGPAPRESDDERFLRYWAYLRLDTVRARLPDNLRTSLNDLKSEFGPVDREPAGPRVTAGFVGPTSPIKSAEILELGVDALLAKLEAWEPTRGWAEPTPEGFARELAAAIKQKPSVVAEIEPSIGRLHPTYVRAILEGGRDAHRDATEIDWPVFLRVARFASFATGPVRSLADDAFDADRDWSAARRSAAWILLVALEAKAVTTETSELTASATLELMRDPDPDVDYEATYGGENMDWSTVATNSTRSLAVLAAIEFVCQEALAEWHPQMLDRLDRAVREDPSLAVHSVFGQRYGPLANHQKRWTSERTAVIFPLDVDATDRWWAAWAAYLTFNRVSRAGITELTHLYAAAIVREPPSKWRFTADPTERLAQHLVAGLVNDYIKISGPVMVLANDQGPESLWVQALAFSGRALSNEALSKIQVRRLMDLWEWRRAAFEAGQATRSQISAFGWWVSSTGLEPAWVLDNLEWVLTRTGLDRSGSSRVMEPLVAMAPTQPKGVLVCANLLVANPPDPWRVHAWRDDLRNLLTQTAPASGDVQELRLELANRLVATWGLLEFREFLDSTAGVGGSAARDSHHPLSGADKPRDREEPER